MTGQYVTFIDSDDMISPYFVSRLVKAIEGDNKIDVAICKYQPFSDGNATEFKDENCDSTLLTGKAGLQKVMQQDGFDVSAWGKLYKSSFFKDMQFREGIIYADLDLIPLLLLKANECIFLNDKLYYYRQNINGIINSRYSGKEMDVVSISHSLMREFENQDSDLKSAVCVKLFSTVSAIVKKMHAHNVVIEEDLKLLINLVKLYNREIKIFGIKRPKALIMILVYRINPQVYIWILRTAG